MKEAKVLILEDEPYYRALLLRYLAQFQCKHPTVQLVVDCQPRCPAHLEEWPDVVISDLVLSPGSETAPNGLQFLLNCRIHRPDSRLALVTGQAVWNTPYTLAGILDVADAFIPKSAEMNEQLSAFLEDAVAA